jgi:hypothetical protein
VILIVPFALDMLEDFLEDGQLTLDPVWTPTAVLGAVVFVVLRTLKKKGCHRPRPVRHVDEDVERLGESTGWAC